MTDRAETPAAPFLPSLRRDLALATAAGLALSLGLVFLLNALNDTIKNPDDVIDRLKIPLLGLAPKVTGGGRLLLSQHVPHEFGEAFRSLRTALMFSSGQTATRCVMVTSAQPLEGKTITACNLALALAIDGARVLLIDADMRRPGVQRMLGIAKGKGLSDVLAGQTSFDAALVTLESPSLSVLTAGTSPANPSELLGSRPMRTLLEQTNGRYDWVIVDTPPVSPVTDAVVLSPLVNAIAFVIGAEMTRCQHAAHALDTLTASSSCHVGVVLNRVDFRRNKHYYARYNGYKNANYYYDDHPASIA